MRSIWGGLVEGPLSSPPLVLMRGLGVRGIMSAEFNPLLQMRSRLVDLLAVELVKVPCISRRNLWYAKLLLMQIVLR